MVFVALGLAVFGLVASVAFMSTVPLNGDEITYANRAQVIADLVAGRGGSLAEVVSRVVGPGWWMPGMSILLAPLHVVDPQPDTLVIRVYATTIAVILWVWATRELSSAFGRGVVVFLIFPTLAAMWLVFAITAWSDLPAGLCGAVVASRIYRSGIRLMEGAGLRFRDLVVAEAAMIMMVYLRGSAIVVVVAVHALLLGLPIIAGRWSRLPRELGIIVAGGMMFAMALAPWSLAASNELGDPVVTTSSAPLALGVTFGDPDSLCFGPCPPRGVWAGELQYSREYASQHGISELEAQRRMAANALEDVTFGEYAAQVRTNVQAFVAPVGAGPRRGPAFMERFVALSTADIPPGLSSVGIAVVSVFTLLVYLPFFLALVVANLIVLVSDLRLQILSLLMKALTVAFFVQPFVHQSHARYWLTYAPVMTLCMLLVVRWLRTRFRPLVAERSRPASVAMAPWSTRALTTLQGVYVTGVLVVVAAIAFG